MTGRINDNRNGLDDGPAGWYLAEVVVRFHIGSEPDTVTHVNLILVSASSAEEAYQKAISHGAGWNFESKNTDGANVVSRFEGLRDLFLIYEELRDGAELLYEKKIGLSDSDIRTMVKTKDQLSVFSRRPDF